MAFLPLSPLLPSSPSSSTLPTPRSLAPRMGSPVAPPNFSPPEPRLARIAPGSLGAILSGAAALGIRGGTGALISGYRVRSTLPREYSATLPASRPAQPLVLYAFLACPFCRRVFEALCVLDIDVLVKPCPKGGRIYREYVGETFGKTMFPYLYDANTGFSAYESGDIISYLFDTYGGTAGVPFALGAAGTSTAALASTFRGMRGGKRAAKVVTPPQPLEVWGYEPSPFCKVVFERLVELEIPYLWHTTPRGSPTREALAEKTGQRFQVPFLVDPNTGIEMFESASIVEYLDQVYGPDAPGAKEEPTDEERAAANAVGVAEEVSGTASAATAAASSPADATGAELNPPSSTGNDPSLESYCEDSPDADECRTYED